MKPYTSYLHIILFLIMTLSMKTRAQQVGDNMFRAVTLEQEPLSRGAEYWRFPYGITNGIVYFGADTITSGNVHYYGRAYYNVPLLYDQSTDELITIDLSKKIMIRLFGPMVDSFQIHATSFLFYHDTANAARQGFWQILVDGQSRLLKKDVKIVKTRIRDQELVRVLQILTSYRLYHHGLLNEISNRDDLLKAFSSKRQEIVNFLKKNKKKFRKAGFEKMLVETTKYYNDLSAR